MIELTASLNDFLVLAQDEPGSGRGYWFIALMLILAVQQFFEKIREKREAEQELQRAADDDEDGDGEGQGEAEVLLGHPNDAGVGSHHQHALNKEIN